MPDSSLFRAFPDITTCKATPTALLFIISSCCLIPHRSHHNVWISCLFPFMVYLFIVCFPHESLSPLRFRDMVCLAHPYMLNIKSSVIQANCSSVYSSWWNDFSQYLILERFSYGSAGIWWLVAGLRKSCGAEGWSVGLSISLACSESSSLSPLFLISSLSRSGLRLGHHSDLSDTGFQSTRLWGCQQLHNGFPACASVH